MTRSGIARLIALLAVAALTFVAGAGAARSRSAVGLDSAKTDRAATVWAVGDGNAYADGQKVAKLVESGKPDRFLYLGDVYEHGTFEEFQKQYRTSFGRLAKITSPTPGNHEWPLHAQGYDVYWRGVLKRTIPQYYRFSIGGWEILSLNSETAHDAGSAQVRWLRTKLKRRGTCRLAFWHRPLISEGQLEGDQPDVKPLWDALVGRATLVVNGHDHNMQRLLPIDGITTLIAGAGGHGLHPVHAVHPRAAFAEDSTYGALRLTLKPGRASYRFVAVGGRTLDAGSVRCKRFKAKRKRRS